MQVLKTITKVPVVLHITLYSVVKELYSIVTKFWGYITMKMTFIDLLWPIKVVKSVCSCTKDWNIHCLGHGQLPIMLRKRAKQCIFPTTLWQIKEQKPWTFNDASRLPDSKIWQHHMAGKILQYATGRFLCGHWKIKAIYNNRCCPHKTEEANNWNDLMDIYCSKCCKISTHCSNYTHLQK